MDSPAPKFPDLRRARRVEGRVQPRGPRTSFKGRPSSPSLGRPAAPQEAAWARDTDSTISRCPGRQIAGPGRPLNF
jgi:hypothetical protein